LEQYHHRDRVGRHSTASSLTILRLGLLVGIQRETLARFETLETLAAMGARCLLVSPTGDRALSLPRSFVFHLRRQCRSSARYNANPNETPCPCRSNSSRGCSASDGQNCHITHSTRGVPCSPGGHVWSERCLGAEKTGPNSTSVACDPHNHSSLITVAVPFRTSTPRRDGPSRQKGQAATENHGHGDGWKSHLHHLLTPSPGPNVPRFRPRAPGCACGKEHRRGAIRAPFVLRPHLEASRQACS
jgi:hypothetical protein